MNLMGQCSNVRQVKRTLPRVMFAHDLCKSKLSPGMKAILSKTTVAIHQDLQLRAINYVWWYENLTTRPLVNLAQEL